MNYYRRMKDLREDNDLTQQDIANYLNVTRGTYSMYECGSNIIPLYLLDQLSLKYQVSIDYLVGLSNEKNNKIVKPMNFDIMCQRLKEQRIKNELSQQNVSKAIGITQSHYATYENGRNILPITRLIKIAKLYNVSIDYLIGKNNEYENMII